jgi:hypothetical protein
MVQGISTNPYRIVPFMKEYIDGIVGLHMQAFSGFFLSSLGRGFLSEYYRCAVGHELSVGYVAVDCDNKVVGLCFGLVDPKSFYKDILKRRWWVFALHSIWAVFRQPIIIPRLLRALKHEGGAPPVNITPLGSLVVTAVKPDDQGVGVALYAVGFMPFFLIRTLITMIEYEGFISPWSVISWITILHQKGEECVGIFGRTPKQENPSKKL